MKNKILAFILTLVFCLPSFASPTDVKAMQTDAGLFETALSLNKSLYPLYPEVEDRTSSVTRGEFANILTGIMGARLTSSTATGFSDVASGSPYAASVAFLTQIGVISRGELFYPDMHITYDQAVKMAVVAAGYGVVAESKGGYPAGYIAVANSLDLADEVSLQTQEMTYEDVAILIYNLLHCEVMQQVSFGDNIEFKSGDGSLFITYYHHIHLTEGIVAANEHSGLTYYGDTTKKGTVKIGAAVYNISDSAYSNMLGHKVRAYYTLDGTKGTIVFMSKHDETEVSINPSDVISVDDFKLKVYEGNKEKEYKISRSYVYIKNGKQYSVTATDHTPYFKLASGHVTMADNDGDGTYDIVFASEYKYSFISSVNVYSQTITDRNSNSNYLDLSDIDITYTIYNVSNGKYVSLSDLDKDMLIAYTESADKKLYSIYICNTVVSGVYTSEIAAENTIYIGDVAYETNPYYQSYYSHVALGTKNDFYLGMDGKITAALESTDGGLLYGWIVNHAPGTKLGDGVKIKIFSQENEMVVTELADKVSVNGTPTTAADTLTFIQGLSDDGKFVKFSTNSDGLVNKIVTATDAPQNVMPGEASRDREDLVRYVAREGNSHTYRASTSLFSALGTDSRSTFKVSSTTYSFVIPVTDRQNDENYQVYTSSESFTDGTTYAVSAYDLDAYSHAGATLFFGEVEEDINGVGTVVVEKVTSALNRNGEPSMAISGYRGNTRKFVTYFTTEETFKTKLQTLVPGDLVRISVNSKNEIKSIDVDFKITDYTFGTRVGGLGSGSEFGSGILYSRTEGYMSIFTDTEILNGKPVVPASPSRDKLHTIKLNDNYTVFVDITRSADGSSVQSATVRSASPSETKSYIEAGSEANFIVYRRYQMGLVTTAIIYTIK